MVETRKAENDLRDIDAYLRNNRPGVDLGLKNLSGPHREPGKIAHSHSIVLGGFELMS